MQVSADHIDQLPTDNSVPNRTEIRLLNTFFKEKANTINKVFTELKGAVLAGLLFAILSLPLTDRLVKSVVKSTEENLYFLILTKTLIFVVLYYVIKNLWVVRT